MRGRSYSKNRNRSIEVGKSKLKEEPQLCGAFIRGLVRQLSSSRTKEPMNSSSPGGKVGDKPSQNLTKKVVRRRFHTSRPYQERLLNMAEARREIVAALKFHRATMRKASEQQQQQHSALEQEVLSRTTPTPIERSCLGKKYRSNTSTITICDHLDNTSFLSTSHPPYFSWSSNSISPVSISENFNLVPPKPPLGLNLNFDGFENLETTFRCSSNSSLSVSFSSPHSTVTSSSSASSSYSCSSCTTMLVTEAPLVRPTAVSEATSEPRVDSLHPVMDDEEMEEIRSIGEQHSMEWNDKLNSVHLAWWCEFLKTVETDFHGKEERIYSGEVDGFGLVDEAIGVPPWLSDQQHLDDYSTDAGCLEDATLPCLDTGQNEGNDPEWLLKKISGLHGMKCSHHNSTSTHDISFHNIF